MKTKIYFIESSTSFNKNYLDSPSIAGSEKTLINITNELSKNDDLIINVFNKTDEPFKLGNLEWNNINEINKYEFPDFLIAMSDAKLLSFTKSKKKFLWSHSVQPIEKFIRKKQLFSFFSGCSRDGGRCRRGATAALSGATAAAAAALSCGRGFGRVLEVWQLRKKH